MTYDPSMTITSTIPAPEGSDSTSREGKAIPLPRDGGRQRFTRPGRTATRYGKDRWRYDL